MLRVVRKNTVSNTPWCYDHVETKGVENQKLWENGTKIKSDVLLLWFCFYKKKKGRGTNSK